MTVYEDKINEILTLFRSIMIKFSNDIENSPPGGLISQVNHGKVQFLHDSVENGSRVRRGITHNEKMLRALAQKKFAEKALKVLAYDAALLEKTLEKFKAFDIDEILRSMTKAYAQLEEDYFFDRGELEIDLHLDGEEAARIARHSEWAAEEYAQRDQRDKNKSRRTSRGLRTDSKSEQLICETLYRYEIPFRYEPIIYLGFERVVPDFVFEGGDGKPFYWEHLGMMDDPGYEERNYKKINNYRRAGIILGRNLILSYDRDGIIDMKSVDNLIQGEVIPRL